MPYKHRAVMPWYAFLVMLLLILSLTGAGAMRWNATCTHAGTLEVGEVRYFTPSYLRTTGVDIPIWRAVAALICGAIAATLSSAGGVGGGGLYVPIFNLLVGLNSKSSAALSSCMIFGGTFVNLFWYALRRRADDSGPLIDYQVSLLCLPNVLLGITAGVICNVASPTWLVTVILIIVLSFMTFRCFRSACQRWKSETSALQSVVISSGPVKDNACEHVVSNDCFDSPASDADEKCGNEELENPLLERQDVVGQPQYPALKIAMLIVVWVVFLAVQVIRGSSDGQNLFGIQTCGAIYWTVTIAQAPFAIFVTTCTFFYLQKSPDAELMENFASGGLVKMTWLPVCALGAGFLGGMLGLGGGTIISPLLLEIGMHPQTSAATSSFMVFFSSSLSMIQFWLLGLILEEYAIIAAAVSLVFSIVGLQVVQNFILKYGRVSLIVFAVSIVMGISAFFMTIFGIWDVVLQIEEGDYMGFQSPC